MPDESRAGGADAHHVDQAGGPHSAINAPLLVALLLLPVLGFGLYRLAVTGPVPDPAAAPEAERAVGLLIDPNSAPWWEMTVIPGVGEVTAKRIVEFRESRRREPVRGGRSPDGAEVFRCPADLQQVKGIGPKTVQRMGPYLTFGRSGASE